MLAKKCYFPIQMHVIMRWIHVQRWCNGYHISMLFHRHHLLNYLLSIYLDIVTIFWVYNRPWYVLSSYNLFIMKDNFLHLTVCLIMLLSLFLTECSTAQTKIKIINTETTRKETNVSWILSFDRHKPAFKSNLCIYITHDSYANWPLNLIPFWNLIQNHKTFINMENLLNK